VRLPDPPLLLITDRKQARKPLEDVLGAAFAAGCRWASMREKDLPAHQQVALARRLAVIARDWNARLTLHGDPALAHEAGLDGVHLAAGADASLARRTLGASALIGLSIHSVADAESLDPSLVDYAIAGPAYATASKPGYGPFLGPAGIGRIAHATSVPILAIGGIAAATIADMRAAGAAGVAVMGGIMRAQDPADEVRGLLAALPPGTPRSIS
jgi:thiamine-phosphate pyrophosphorylase